MFIKIDFAKISISTGNLVMNNRLWMALFFLTLLPFNGFASTDDQKLLDLFHKHGMNKCDKFILQNASLKNKPNWSLDIEDSGTSIGKNYPMVTLVVVYGFKGDTVKTDYSFIETPTNCYLSKRSTVSANGSCDDHVDGDIWYIANQLPYIDYTLYYNKGHVPMYAKETNVGNFKFCVQEYRLDNESKHG